MDSGDRRLMKLTNEKTAQINGEYSYKVYMSSGSAKLQMRDGNESWTDIPDTSVTSSTGKIIKFAGELKAVLTGDAVVYLKEVS